MKDNDGQASTVRPHFEQNEIKKRSKLTIAERQLLQTYRVPIPPFVLQALWAGTGSVDAHHHHHLRLLKS